MPSLREKYDCLASAHRVLLNRISSLEGALTTSQRKLKVAEQAILCKDRDVRLIKEANGRLEAGVAEANKEVARSQRWQPDAAGKNGLHREIATLRAAVQDANQKTVALEKENCRLVAQLPYGVD